MIRAFAAGSLAWLAFTMAAYSQQPADQATPKDNAPKGETAQQQAGKPIPPLPELIKKLEADLSNATLVGVFTIDGMKSDKPLKPDRYTLGKVRKLSEGDLWSFEAKVGFGGSNVMIPIIVSIKWAGDTPMIQLTNTTIPGMGTYSTRVFFYDDRYAGTWVHGKFAGHMYGSIEKGGQPGKQEEKPRDK